MRYARAASGPAAPWTCVSIALATFGGGTAARAAASARSESRALCGVKVSGSRSGSSGMIWAIDGIERRGHEVPQTRRVQHTGAARVRQSWRNTLPTALHMA